jgi:hypothetical protein
MGYWVGCRIDLLSVDESVKRGHDGIGNDTGSENASSGGILKNGRPYFLKKINAHRGSQFNSIESRIGMSNF